VVERRGHACLPFEARPNLGVLRHSRGQNLDCNVTAEPRVARAVDFAHAARAERGDDLVGAEASVSGEWHRGSLPHGEATREVSRGLLRLHSWHRYSPPMTERGRPSERIAQ